MKSSYIQRVKAMLLSKDPAVVNAVKAANEGLLRCKAVIGSVHQDAALTNLSIQYKNEDYIGTQLMPVTSVPKLSDKWYTYNKRDRLTGPDDNLGSRSKANEINENRSTSTYSCDPYGLSNFVDELTLQNQDAPLNEMVDLVQSVNDVMDLKEEIRIAAIMTTSTNYDTANTAALTGSDRWDVATSDPISKINAAIDACWMGSGATRMVGFCGVEVFRALQNHPAINEHFKYTEAGMVTRAQIAGMFDLDDLLVGRARKDTANEGQAASYGRVWGKQFGVARVAKNPSPRIAAFGFTLRFQGQRTTTQWFDQTVGTRGGYFAKVGVEEVHKVTANDTGYLYTTVIS